mmetsp:Transcript_44405/g.134582  ORF Transcript_44405/g.134582 Transcript_44405/m.134582 type:complete len:253 (-) Transcript_44405:206-964(-)
MLSTILSDSRVSGRTDPGNSRVSSASPGRWTVGRMVIVDRYLSNARNKPSGPSVLRCRMLSTNSSSMKDVANASPKLLDMCLKPGGYRSTATYRTCLDNLWSTIGASMRATPTLGTVSFMPATEHTEISTASVPTSGCSKIAASPSESPSEAHIVAEFARRSARALDGRAWIRRARANFSSLTVLGRIASHMLASRSKWTSNKFSLPPSTVVAPGICSECRRSCNAGKETAGKCKRGSFEATVQSRSRPELN